MSRWAAKWFHFSVPRTWDCRFGCCSILFAGLDVRGTDLISVLRIFNSRRVTLWLRPVSAIPHEGKFFLSEFWARPFNNGTMGEAKISSFSKGLAKVNVTARRSNTIFSAITVFYSTWARCFRHPIPLPQILLPARKIMYVVTLNVVIPSLSVPEWLLKKNNKKAEQFYWYPLKMSKINTVRVVKWFFFLFYTEWYLSCNEESRE